MPSLPPSPGPIRAIAAITVAQVLIVAVLAFIELLRPGGVFEDPGLHIFWLLVIALTSFASWQLLQARPWARSVLITWHLLLAMSFIASIRLIGFTALIGFAASAIAIFLFTRPSAREFIVDRRSEMLDD